MKSSQIMKPLSSAWNLAFTLGKGVELELVSNQNET